MIDLTVSQEAEDAFWEARERFSEAFSPLIRPMIEDLIDNHHSPKQAVAYARGELAMICMELLAKQEALSFMHNRNGMKPRRYSS